MGTSHRHIPGVTGEPNWGKTSLSVTSISKAVEESEELENNPPKNKTPKSIEKRQQVLENRIKSGYHKAVHNLVRAAGGRNAVSSGNARALGHAGVARATAWTRAFQEISEQGLATWLSDRGVSLIGKSCHEVIEILGNFMYDYLTGLDDTAANEALDYVLKFIEKTAEGNLEKIDNVLNNVVQTDLIKDILDKFFGMYIFSHLSQDFYEKLCKDRGVDNANETMKEIKKCIFEDVSHGVNGRDAGSVDWKGEEGTSFIKKEFDRIIKIISNDED
jgi:hypothetical protein